MNQQAIPVLITFLAVAGIAALLLRRALTTLSHRRDVNEAQPTQAKVAHPELQSDR
ncbi:DUF2973 domain-containing protein [Stutzerimonas chloritidismutans]|uniref:Uncharacterized protein n=1 Tax=Stutzerimonas chloritidismutans TaxID=203192 RepID=A0ABU9M783_STUCH